jgi:hypothetical protein
MSGHKGEYFVCTKDRAQELGPEIKIDIIVQRKIHYILNIPKPRQNYKKFTPVATVFPFKRA